MSFTETTLPETVKVITVDRYKELCEAEDMINAIKSSLRISPIIAMGVISRVISEISDNYISLAEKCKYIREKLDWSQGRLSREITSNQNEVSCIERGMIPDESAIRLINKLYNELKENNNG